MIRSIYSLFCCSIILINIYVIGQSAPISSVDRSAHAERLEAFLSTPGSTPSLPDERWYLDSLFVHPSYQNLGAATKLIDDGKERAKSEGVSVVVSCNDTTKPWYGRRGFHEVPGGKTEGDIEREIGECGWSLLWENGARDLRQWSPVIMIRRWLCFGNMLI